jgi:hypothetical protein
VKGVLGFQKRLNVDFLSFKLSFGARILACFSLVMVLATFQKNSILLVTLL